jgi:hypothetical protein
VRLASDRPPGDWLSVHLADGSTGYIDERYVRSPISYRAYFERMDGRWVLTMFIAGD